jgi:hypothetical protein
VSAQPATKTSAIRDAATAAPPAPPSFSLVQGGLLFQTWRRLHLSGESLEFLRRRVLFITLLAWLPLLLLSVIDGNLDGGAIRIPFLQDLEAHVRFLVALPLLIVAEVIVHERISPLIRRFVDHRIVAVDDVPAFNEAVRFTVRARNSIALEAALLGLVYTLGLWLWRSEFALDAATWYARPDGGHIQLTLAGRWYAWVSIPIFQFLMVRWYLRMVLWFHLLWRISRLPLHLVATHPDCAGGIGFLGDSAYAFSPVLFAQGALLSGLIANRVLYQGQNVLSFKMDAAGLVCALALFVLGPLVMFTPQLDRARERGEAEYGRLANRYVSAFHEKWIRGEERDTPALLGSSDIQSLAAVGDSYVVVSDMRRVPFGRDDVLWLVAATTAPLLPLALTMFSLQELLTRLVKILF